MTYIESFCTYCLPGCQSRLISLLITISKYYPNTTVFVATLSSIRDDIRNYPIKLDINVVWMTEDFDLFFSYTPGDDIIIGDKIQFSCSFFKLLNYAMERKRNTLYIDIFSILLEKINLTEENMTKEVCGIPMVDMDGFSHIMFLINDKCVADKWLNLILQRTFNALSWDISQNYTLDDITLTDYVNDSKFINIFFNILKQRFKILGVYDEDKLGYLGKHNNISTWDFFRRTNNVKLEDITSEDGKIYYKEDLLSSITITTQINQERYHRVNLELMNKLKNTSNYYLTLFQIQNGHKIPISIPKKDTFKCIQREHDGLYELIELFHSKYEPFITVYETLGHQIIFNNVNVLFGSSTNDAFTNDLFNKHIYCGSLDIYKDCDELDKFGISYVPWIYWPKHPKQVEDYLRDNSYNSIEDRSIESIFIGSMITKNHIEYRNHTLLDKYIEYVKIHRTSDEIISYTEYLNYIAKSKYGICLTGNNIKSTRLMEYLSVGTVPIIVGDIINTNSFENPLVDGIHYIRVLSIEDIPTVMDNINEYDWSTMSMAGKEWYYTNVHSDNSLINLITRTVNDSNKYEL